MTEEEKKAYFERGKERVKNGEFLKLFRAGGVTTWKMEEALKDDAGEWIDDFFNQFMGTPELQSYYNQSEDNKRFLNELFRHAFMFGGSYAMKAYEKFMLS